MAKFEVTRANLCYAMDDEIITNANDIISFCAETNGPRTNRWFGFYDINTNAFRVIPSEWDEVACLEFESREDETLTQLEARLRSLIYNYCGDVVNLATVATDNSCMEEMKWTPPKKVNEYDWNS